MVFGIVRNIPKDYHSSDLRNFFSQFIECSRFECFHYRHRPEKHASVTAVQSSGSVEGNTSPIDRNLQRNIPSIQGCCIIKLTEANFKRLVKMYHRKHWLDRNGETISKICFISKIKVAEILNSPVERYKTRGEQKLIPSDRETFSPEDLSCLPELHPPPLMRNGNVGTPTLVFMDLIKQCKLPPDVIKKLGLQFPKLRSNKRYGNVGFDYGNEVVAGSGPDDVVLSANGQELKIDRTEMSADDKTEMPASETRNSPVGDCGVDDDNDDDTCEEWERHEALYDDPDNQERNSERLFEEEIELKWEKGGSGLVFYTDAQYWKEKEGDFDEQTADDWDVDMSVYYEKNSGDKDARDMMTMRREQSRRNGIYDDDDEIFKKRRKIKDEDDDDDDSEREKIYDCRIGKFEKHTKGFGRKFMEKQGWKEGQGLGTSRRPGIADALENDGQNPKSRRGFGYYGEKLVSFSNNFINRRRPDRQFIISTVYDDPKQTDPPETVSRRNNHYSIKYRQSHIDFMKSKQR